MIQIDCLLKEWGISFSWQDFKKLFRGRNTIDFPSRLKLTDRLAFYKWLRFAVMLTSRNENISSCIKKMDNQLEQFCARCGNSLHCRKDTVEECACSLIELNEETIGFLRKTSYGCLCNDCLQHFDELTATAKGLKFPTAAGELTAGLYYYIENNNWVFTELYHFLRGYCCRNGCRNCVYGYNRQKM